MITSIITSLSAFTASFFPFECMDAAFMKRALLGLLLISPLSAVTGIQVVNSKMSFFSDAIGHSAFAGVALGLIMSVSPTISMPILALLVGFLIMYLRRDSRLSSDTVIGVTFSAVVAFGLAIVSRHRAASKEISMFLFGDILTISEYDIAILLVLFFAFLIFQFFSYNRMISISVNPQLASVHRVRVAVYQYTFAALLSLVVIFSVRAVGVILVTALLVVPAASSRNFAKNAGQMFWISLIIGILSALAGFIISGQTWAKTPAGATIVLYSSVIFVISFIYARFRPNKTSDMDK